MKLTKRIQECKNYEQARPILEKAGARPTTKRLIETTFTLSNSNNSDDQTRAVKSMKQAFKELEKDGLADNEINEEELANNNTGGRTTGSEQSTKNEEPYPGEGKDSTSGEKAMQDLDGAMNQWGEAAPSVDGGVDKIPPPAPVVGTPPTGGMPPQHGGMIVPGLAPMAQEMGMDQQHPPMDPQTMQYIQQIMHQEMDNFHNKVTKPIREGLNKVIREQYNELIQQRKVITILSQQQQETKNTSGNLKFDLDYMRKNANATFRETEGGIPGGFVNSKSPQTLEEARAEINAMDKFLKSGNKSIYN